MRYLWRAKRYKVYSGNYIWRYYLQLFFVYKTVSELSFKLFCLGDKRLLSEFLIKWGRFQGHNKRFSKYLGWKVKFTKTDTRFCRQKITDNNDINIFLSLENLCNLFLAKERTWKRIFNANSELSQKCIEKDMPFKTKVNWLFYDIWCYIVIGHFSCKTGIFERAVVYGLSYP